MLIIFQAFPIVVSSLGLSGLFFICAGSSILGALFTFIFIPTTKDKSMFELEMLFAHNQKTKKGLDLSDPEKILKTELDPNYIPD